ncbi:beta strand repeat-containing protein, partial [Phascolarctobacterium sp.]
MRRFNKSKKAAILASVLGSSLFVSSAFAANLLITVPSDYTSSNMAVITGSRVTSDVDSNPIRGALESLNRDPSAYAFVMDGKSMFLLRQYNYSTSTLIPNQLLDADVDWNNPVSATGTITKAANPHSAIGKNGYLYTGDYDLGTISVSRVNGKSLKEEVEKTVDLLEDINNYCGGSLSKAQNAWVHGEGLQIKGDSLYVVVSVNPKGGYDPYDDSYLMEYKINSDGSLTLKSYTRSVRNPDTVRLENYNNLLMHTGIGGYQNVGAGNSTTGITIADVGGGKLSEKATRTVVLPENVQANGLDLRNMSVWPNGTVYILAYNLSSSGGGSQMTVYKTTVANLNSDNPKNWEEIIKRSPEGGGDSGVATGWFNSFFAEYYTKRLWGEFGNDIVVYKDGDSQPSLSWTAKNLANNNIYHTFNSVALLKGDAVTGEKALLTKTTEEGLTSPFSTMTSVVNLNANMKKADYNKQISGSDKDTLYTGVTSDNKTYNFDTDKVIGLGTNSWKNQADLSNNILAAIYAHDGNDITINSGKNTLQLQVQNIIATPVGVYASNGKNVTVNAGKLNIITSGVAGGNSLTNAIMNDAGKDKASKITINGDVNITMSGGNGGNGVAIQKTDRWGEASYASNVENSITINGDLNIKGADSNSWGIPLNEENALSRFNNAGILAQVENSRVDVSGAANMDVYGNGITTNAKNSTVSIGGGEINVPAGMKYGYYTLGAYQGTINVNTGKNGESVGANDVKLGGDIFALKTGTINVALTTADSYLHGIVDNGGTVNLWLQNGASWTNVQNNERYEQDNEDVGSNGLSHVTKLVGGSAGNEGVIFQQAGSKDITVDNYSGSTMLIYGHDSKTPTSILGGNFTIGNAAAGSAITLRTDSSGIDMSSDTDKNAVLNALANKLYYTGFTKGENNLSGYVQLAEGLTAASESVFVGNIKYSSADGQGSLDGSGEGAKAEKPSGDNSEKDKNFLVENDSWDGSNSGDNVKLTLKTSSSWTGDNSGKNLHINAAESTWKGNNSGAGANITLTDSAWTGRNTAEDTKLTLDGASEWFGGNTGAGFTLSLLGNSTWKVQGDTVIDIFNSGNNLRMRAAGGPVVDMTDAAAGNVVVNKYNGDATVLYAHDAKDSTKMLGGNFTVKNAVAGSSITLITDNSGVEASNKYSINDTLNALANKLYYTASTTGEKNLSGTVKIAEGLTAVSAAKHMGNIAYGKDGQGSLDKSSVDYGKDFPTVQNKAGFSSSITGDYVTDKEYRDAGVLSDTNNIYSFTKDATTITNDSGAVTTAKDTTLQLNKHDMTITASSGDGIATTGGTLTVKDAGSLTVTGAKAINANNSKVDITAVNATLNGDVSTNSAVSIKATKAAKVNGAVSANGANAAVSINGTDGVAITGAVSANGANAAVTIDSADTTIGSDITANGKDAKVTAKNLSKLDGSVTTDADGSVELTFKEGAAWSGDNAGNTTMSLSKGSWNGANTGKLNATLTNGTTWTGDSSGAGSTIKLDASSWNGANSGANATVNLTDSSWTGDNSGAGLSLTANNSKWNGSTNAAGSAVLTNGSVWSGASTSADFSLILNGSTWNNSGASSLKSFTGTNGIVDMTNAATSVTIGSYSGDATVIYKHNSSNPAEVYGGNFTVNKAAANSKITMLTDNTGVDTTDEDKINEALDALAGKLFYTGAIGGAENNLSGTVKIAEGLTAASVAKQTAGIVYDKITGRGSADYKSVTPGPVYPTEQDRTAFVTSITGEHLTDMEYRKAGVLSNTVDNNIYNFTKEATTITTAGSAVTTAKDTTLELNKHDMTITANSGDGIATTGGTLTVKDAGSLTVTGTKAINANNSKVDITAVNATLNGDV